MSTCFRRNLKSNDMDERIAAVTAERILIQGRLHFYPDQPRNKRDSLPKSAAVLVNWAGNY